MNSNWVTVTESSFPWEREALDYIRLRLADEEPYRAWANFEFIGDDGSLNEVDLLVVSRYRVFLVEIKSRPGLVTGDQGTWTWTDGTRLFVDDNPLFRANRKAKKLKSLLSRQPALKKQRLPFLEPLVFLSHPEQQCQLDPSARGGVCLRTECLRSEADRQNYLDVVETLTGQQPFGQHAPQAPIDGALSRDFARAMQQLGIRPAQGLRRVLDYRLGELLTETDAYQDWEAQHVTLGDKVRRRIRLYPNALAATDLSREERRRVAEREFQILEGIDHAGILRALDFTENERGPALIFDHDPSAQRLDLFLKKKHDRLDRLQRLGLVRQIAEALKFAHEHRLYHRSLSPQTVLVQRPDTADPLLKIFDWQSGKRSDSADSSRRSTSDGLNVGLFGDRQGLLYVAPEAIAGTAFDAVKLDVFSLGAIAYHVFSGQPPAASIPDLLEKCSAGNGLSISAVLDGASQELQDLIQGSTCPAAGDRFGSVTEFIKRLDDVEKALSTPAPEPVANPIEAKIGDRLEGGFEVKRRLGQGSTSVAWLVEKGDRTGVLKVALRPELNDRIRAEGQVLHQLRHQNIVELYEVIEISGLTALFLAPPLVPAEGHEDRLETLAERLRDGGRLSLDLLQRFGEELLTAVQWLEDKGISHRDIKPDNISIGEVRAKGKLTLVLFDFSLSGTPVENIRAGTPIYLDPFLRHRKPPRWDLYAERFAAAVTLYEMATGTLPKWGDGQSDPAMLDC